MRFEVLMAMAVKIIILCHVVCRIFFNILEEPAISSFMQMEAAGIAEVLVIIYQTIIIIIIIIVIIYSFFLLIHTGTTLWM
jgi:hypothetical protein